MVGAGVSVLAACVSFYFYRMERRIRSLLHAAEDAIEPLEQDLASQLDNDALRIVQRVKTPGPGQWAYSKVFRSLYFTTGAAFILGLLYVVWAAFRSTPASTEFKITVQATIGIALLFCSYEILSLERNDANTPHAIATRWSLLALGMSSGLSGIASLLQLIFYRL